MRLDGPDVALILLILLLLQLLFLCSDLPSWLLLLPNKQSQLGTVGRQPPIQSAQPINVALVSNPLALLLLLLLLLIIAIDISNRPMCNCSCSLCRCR